MSKKKNQTVRRKRKPVLRHPAARVSLPAEPPKAVEQLVNPTSNWWLYAFLPGLMIFLLVFVYAYFPTLVWVVENWVHEPDYSHGFLVVPLACLILYHRSETFPGFRTSLSYGGLGLVVLAILMRFVSRMIYADFLDAWSMIPLLAGIVWFLWGFKAMTWALPAIGFLFFMIPMPYQAETMMSWKLQGVATDVSTAILRVLGQPAVSEGHIVWVNGERLMIEQACSGLRIFIGVGALAYFWAAVTNRSWIDRVIILASAIPLAILANSIRITLIGFLYLWFKDPDTRHQLHDLTGLAMIPLAFAMLWLVKRYWEELYRPVSQITAKDFMRQPAG